MKALNNKLVIFLGFIQPHDPVIICLNSMGLCEIISIYLDLIEAVFCCHQHDPNDGGLLKLWSS